ncbi:MAG TPA: hypothetical protein VFY99_01050 [Solirubrobacterales bacterium]
MPWMNTDPDSMKQAIAESGWVDGEIVAVGHLRQGKAPTAVGMATGFAVWEVLRPRRSKLLPRHFVLAVTPDRVVAFKAAGGSGEDSSHYELKVLSGEQASFPRASVAVSGLTEGPRSKGATLKIDGQSFPVSRPNLSGDPNTDECLAALGGLAV